MNLACEFCVGGEAYIEAKSVYKRIARNNFTFVRNEEAKRYDYGYFDSCNGDSGGPAIYLTQDRVK